MEDDGIGHKELLVARSDKRCRRVQHMSADEE